MMKFCVFGNPIKQSRSPEIHQHFALMCNITITYEKCLVPLGKFKSTVDDFFAKGGLGANVTVPFKEEALALCDQLSDRAKAAGAVNTLRFANGEIYGDNTDGAGLTNDLLNKGVKLNNKRILIIGAGGAAKGVLLPILTFDPHSITVINRTEKKANDLIEQFEDNRLLAGGLDLPAEQAYDVVINATSASLSQTTIKLATSAIDEHTVCYDMVYGAEPTSFMLYCQQMGANQTYDGLGMLVGQAAESFNLWTGYQPNATETLTFARKTIVQ